MPGHSAIQGAWLRKFFAVFSIEPQDGAGGCCPRPRKLRLRLGDDRGRDGQSRLHQDRRQHVRKDVSRQDLARRQADGAGALHIVLRLDRQRLAPRQAHEDRRGREADGDHRVGQRRPEESRQRDSQDQERRRQQRLSAARDHGVRPAAEIARDDAQRHPDRDRDQNRDAARQQRRLRPPDKPRQDVAPDLVGSQRMRGRRRLPHRAPIRRDRVGDRQQRRRQRDRDEEEHQRPAEERAVVPAELAPGAAALAPLGGCFLCPWMRDVRHQAQPLGVRIHCPACVRREYFPSGGVGR